MKNLIPIFFIFSNFIFAQTIDWTTTLGGNYNDYFEKVIYTNDNGYLCVGKTNSTTGSIFVENLTPNVSTDDGILVKIDETGAIEWKISIGSFDDDEINDVKQTSDGGFILVGNSIGTIGFDPNCTFCSSFEFWIVKINSIGEIEWERKYGSSASESALSVDVCMDGSYVVAGYSMGSNGNVSTSPQGTSDIWIIKVDHQGNLVWEKSYGRFDFDEARSVKACSDGGIMVVGVSESSSSVSATTDIIILKLNNLGLLEWQQVYGNINDEENANDVVENEDGSFTIVGSAKSLSEVLNTSYGNFDAIAFNINSLGQIIWTKKYGGSNIDGANSIFKQSNGNYFIGGNTRSNSNDFSNNQGNGDAWIAEISQNGDLIWNQLFGGTNTDLLSGISSNGNGSCVFVGSTNSSNGTFQSNEGLYDAFAIKINFTTGIPEDTDSTFTVTICGDSYSFQGTNYTQSGTYFDTIMNQAGADSLLTLNLTLYPNQASSFSESSCGSYLFNGDFLNESGTYIATFQTIHGCDSVVTLNLTILPKPEREITINTCNSHTWIDGITYFSSTNEPTYIVEMANGCDSLLTLNLTINQVNTSVIDSGMGTLTANSNENYQWFNCETQSIIPSETEISFSPTQNGIYSVILENAAGCIDTSDCYIVDYLNLNSNNLTEWTLSPNPANEYVTIFSTSGILPSSIEVCDLQGKIIHRVINENTINISSLTAGIYLLQIISHEKQNSIHQLIVQ